ncbi:MAG: tRNA (guanosine(46)-N7)-methyltransferase TrmB [Flavobacteriales bacterium]|nr:tRNA (guanosine(46)-N7)-methyltransferase TrmB [Flavobacteriales bacterium]
MTEPDLSKKLARFAEVAALDNCVEVPNGHVIKDFGLRGKWASDHFGNDWPITLELACGKGEYSLGQARLFPDRNFIGVDIKGNRIWRGATEAKRDGLTNVAYLRTRIDFIDRLFGPEEVSEIWVIFPDPQPQKDRKKLTSPLFLDRYRQLLKQGGTVNLKTDNYPLWEFTMEVIAEQKLTVLGQSTDLYADLDSKASPYLNEREDILRIRTYYEGLWLKEGRKINFVSFTLQS